MKLFGEYSIVDEGINLNVPIREVSDNLVITLAKTYNLFRGNVYINYQDHGLSVSNTVYLDWVSGNLANATANTEGPFTVITVVNTNQFIIYSNAYLANTLLPNTSGTVNVGKVIY
jgi:hypothetical protein